jgi:hypothetical protein
MKTKIINLLYRSASVRTMRQLTPVFVFCGALGLLTGCTTTPESHMVSAPPPPAPTRSVTTTTTTTTPDTVPGVIAGNPANVTIENAAPGTITTIVNAAPPAQRPDVVLAQPSPDYVWLVGYWTWHNDNGYRWVAGHWELPPRTGSVWVAPHCEQQGNAYKYYEGYWT